MVACHLQLTITQLGHDVTALCESAEGALQSARQTVPDLVLMDITLKGKMNGIECASFLKELYNVPIIYLTALTDKETMLRAEQSQPFGYISKPFDDEEIADLISKALCA